MNFRILKWLIVFAVAFGDIVYAMAFSLSRILTSEMMAEYDSFLHSEFSFFVYLVFAPVP